MSDIEILQLCISIGLIIITRVRNWIFRSSSDAARVNAVCKALVTSRWRHAAQSDSACGRRWCIIRTYVSPMTD